MLKKLDSIPTVVVLALLALVAVASHWMLISIGLLLHDSEWSAFLLAADWFRASPHHERHIDVFAFQLNYGGLTLTALRALWIGLFPTKSHLLAHMTFSYAVCPVIAAWIFYALARSLVSRWAALLTGLVFAIGFQGMALYYGDEFYPLVLFLGAGLLALRGNTDNPLSDFSPRRLFLAAFLSGHILFATRMGGVFLVAFWVPWTWAVDELRLIVSKLRKQNTATGVAAGVAAFGVYLEVFGRDLGTVFGRAIKIDGLPNIKVGVLIYTASRAWELRKDLMRNHLPKKVAVLVFGAFLGFLPDLVYRLRNGRVFSDQVLGHQSFAEFWHVFGVIPERLRVLMTGSAPFRMLQPVAENVDPGIGAAFSLAVVLAGAFALWLRAQKDFRARPFLLLAGLNLFAFCWIWTPYLELGPPRYLFPLFVSVGAGIAVLFERIAELARSRVERERVAAAMLAVAVVVSCTHHLRSRVRLVEKAKHGGQLENLHAIVDTFRSAKVDTVLSDDFWYSNNLTLAANANPGFWASWRDWGPYDIRARALATKQAGLLLERKGAGPKGRALKQAGLLGRSWELQFLRTIGDRDLYLGRAL